MTYVSYWMQQTLQQCFFLVFPTNLASFISTCHCEDADPDVQVATSDHCNFAGSPRAFYLLPFCLPGCPDACCQHHQVKHSNDKELRPVGSHSWVSVYRSLLSQSQKSPVCLEEIIIRKNGILKWSGLYRERQWNKDKSRTLNQHFCTV